MSQENVDFVRGLFSAVPDMDKDEFLAALPQLVENACDPEIEWIEDPSRADARTYSRARGRDRVVAPMARELRRVGRDLEEVRDCGDRVLATVREEGRGRSSGRDRLGAQLRRD